MSSAPLSFDPGFLFNPQLPPRAPSLLSMPLSGHELHIRNEFIWRVRVLNFISNCALVMLTALLADGIIPAAQLAEIGVPVMDDAIKHCALLASIEFPTPTPSHASHSGNGCLGKCVCRYLAGNGHLADYVVVAPTAQGNIRTARAQQGRGAHVPTDCPGARLVVLVCPNLAVNVHDSCNGCTVSDMANLPPVPTFFRRQVLHPRSTSRSELPAPALLRLKSTYPARYWKDSILLHTPFAFLLSYLLNDLLFRLWMVSLRFHPSSTSQRSVLPLRALAPDFYLTLALTTAAQLTLAWQFHDPILSLMAAVMTYRMSSQYGTVPPPPPQAPGSGERGDAPDPRMDIGTGALPMATAALITFTVVVAVPAVCLHKRHGGRESAEVGATRARSAGREVGDSAVVSVNGSDHGTFP
ncbi:hypothetical protein BCR44DRAFT_408452 [Catenaria anguillulae PL171]|uniref:Uncharacterized protein n=1 Tax=Catenaria anguillulae PL171 TaxID=765915 RepID=A0A1Y2H7Y9_9FUNG|nr:hypothetical protein BCR44DRAFT_408452 [Catenaria anguillulae PL171]